MYLGVLGSLRATVDEEPVVLGSGRQRRLLAALAVEPRTVVPVERLVWVLWGDQPPRSALQSLRTYVYRLRGALGAAGSAVVTRPPGYVLDLETHQVDAGRFEQLLTRARQRADDARSSLVRIDEALALWRGPAFAEFADEPFARGEAMRLEELRQAALEERVDRRLMLGEHAEVVGEVEALIEQEPLRERPRRQLMLALYRCGRQAEALEVLRAYRAMLAEEHGLEVSASLESLEREILQRSPALDLTAPGSGVEDRFTGPVVTSGPARPPREPTRLIGRDRDVAAVRSALGASRLVTITGVGGVGKSRLAQHVAQEAAADVTQEAWWCELVPISHEQEVAEAVATSLGVRPAAGRSATDAVVESVTQRHGVLVLDNAEHVAEGVRRLVEVIISRAARTRLLVTSRAPLGLAGEQLHPLGTLTVVSTDTGETMAGPALELFLERIRAVRPDLIEAGVEHEPLIEVCRRLDGLPLALELAAGRLRSLNPVDLVERLDRRLDLIADPRQSTGRHRGLRAMVDWSYEALTRVEQRLFARLSVFAGSFTLDAAERIGAGDGVADDEILDLLRGLVDRSLVATLPTAGPTRYQLLETLRSYGDERLQRFGEHDTVRRRHAEYHLALATTADRQVRSRDEAEGVAVLDREFDDLRAAQRWCVEHGEVDLAVRLVAALFRYGLWRLRAELFSWAEHVAELPGASTHPTFPTVAGMAGWGAGLRGDLETAVNWAERGLAVTDGPDDERVLIPLEVLMHAAMWGGELDACLRHARHAAELRRDPYDLVPDYVPGLALTYAGRAEEARSLLSEVQIAADRHGNPTMRSLVHYARAEALLGADHRAAWEQLELAARLAAEVDNRVVLGVADVSLITLLSGSDQVHAALRTFTAVIDRLEEVGDWTHLWTGLRGLVDLLVRVDDEEAAAVMLGAVRGAESAPPIYGEDAARLAALERQLAQRLGPDAFAAAHTRGAGLGDREAVAFARTRVERHTSV